MRFRGKRFGPALGAVVVGALTLAGTASATSYCVNEPVCAGAGGINEGTTGDAVQKALEAAESHANSGGPDEVAIGAGSYSRPGAEAYSYFGDAAVIRGAGAGATVLAHGTANTATVLNLASAGSTVRGLTVEMPAVADGTGVGLSGGTVEAVTIAGAKAGKASAGLKLNAGTFAGGSIAMPTSAAIETTGVEASGGEVKASTIAGAYGVQASGAFALRGATITPSLYGVIAFSSSPTVEDALIDLGGNNAFGLFLDANSGTAKGTLRQVTIVNGGASSRGVLVTTENKHVASATLTNSVIFDVEEPLVVTPEAVAGNSASVTADYSSYEFAKDVVGALGTVFGEHAIAGPPGFVSPTLGGFGSGDWRALPTAPLVDAGAPGELQVGEYALDAAGNPRIVNNRRDVGAFEYQRRAPLATATATPASSTVGASIAFDGSATPQEAGDAIASYQWTFDDGATASGARVAHAFTTAGAHTATLTVTDAIGLTATATATVAVGSAPVAQSSGGGSAPAITKELPPTNVGLAALRLAPSAFRAAKSGPSMMRGSRGGARVSYTLQRAATVTFTVELLAPGVVHGKSCVAARRGAHGRRCTRRIELAGSFTQAGAVGANSSRFSGRLSGRALPAGTYALVAHAPGGMARARFKIVR